MPKMIDKQRLLDWMKKLEGTSIGKYTSESALIIGEIESGRFDIEVKEG